MRGGVQGCDLFQLVVCRQQFATRTDFQHQKVHQPSAQQNFAKEG